MNYENRKKPKTNHSHPTLINQSIASCADPGFMTAVSTPAASNDSLDISSSDAAYLMDKTYDSGALSPSNTQRQLTNLPSPILSPRLGIMDGITNSLALDHISDSFDCLSPKKQSKLLLTLLSRSSFSTLQKVALAIQPNLKVDFLQVLPVELSFHILKYLDLRSLSRCTQVSQLWKRVVNSDAIEYSIWKRRLLLEGWFSNNQIQAELSHASKNHGMEDIPDQHIHRTGIIHPSGFFKSIYKQHFQTRQNWLNGRYKNISFPAHNYNVVTCLQCDEEKIVSGSDDQTIQIFDINNGNLLHRLQGHEGGVWALQYVGNTLVSGSTDRSVKIWDLETGECTHTLEGHTSTVRCLLILLPKLNKDTKCYEPATPIFCTGSRDATVRIWSLPDPKILQPENQSATDTYLRHVLTGHSGSVRALAGDHNVLVSGSYDMNVCVWDLAEGKMKFLLKGHREKVYSVGYCHAIKRAASGSMDATVKIWCTETGTQMFSLDTHTSLVGLLDISSDFLVSAAADGTIKIWDPMTGKCYSTQFGHSAPITCFCFDAKLNRFVSGSDGGVKVWELNSFGYPYIEPNLMSPPPYGQSCEGVVPIHGRMLLDLVGGVAGVWRVCMSERRLVTAVQKEGSKTWFEVFDFGSQLEELGTKVNGNGDTFYNHHGEDNEDNDESSIDEDFENGSGQDDDELSGGDAMDEDTVMIDNAPPSAPLMRTLSLPPFQSIIPRQFVRAERGNNFASIEDLARSSGSISHHFPPLILPAPQRFRHQQQHHIIGQSDIPRQLFQRQSNQLPPQHENQNQGRQEQ